MCAIIGVKSLTKENSPKLFVQKMEMNRYYWQQIEIQFVYFFFLSISGTCHIQNFTIEKNKLISELYTHLPNV